MSVWTALCKSAKLIGGMAVNKATYSPGFVANEQAVAAIDVTSGRLLVDAGSITTTAGLVVGTRANSTAQEASRLLKSSAGSLTLFYGFNAGPAQYIQIFDATSVPNDGAAPVLVINAYANQAFSAAMSTTGMPFSNGIFVCNSSTGPSKTIGSSNCLFCAVVV